MVPVIPLKTASALVYIEPQSHQAIRSPANRTLEPSGGPANRAIRSLANRATVSFAYVQHCYSFGH
ncbi:hypothetical protein E2C01_071409 [Portunus trituberculatus]|uniref:Uncharacterized protein n=1 Tax=Portunus trituberculatus TaxID=210409 RepID=A0A5B7HZW7_PORTR|nr:hypothetical protein [Portunus trituberculatus]